MRHIKYKSQFLLLTSALILILSLVVPLVRFLQGNPVNISGNQYIFLQFVNSYPSVFPVFFSSVWFNLILSSLLLVGSLFLFSAIVSKIAKRETEYYLAIVLFATLPAIILAHSGITVFTLLLFSTLFFIYSYTTSKPLFLLLTFILALFAPVIPILFLIYVWLNNKEDSNLLLKYFLAIFGALVVSFVSSVNFFTISFENPIIKHLFTFFGANNGYSIIILLFGLIGTYTFKELNKNKLMLLTIYSLFLLSFFNSHLRVLSLIVMVFLSANALDKLFEEVWKREILKYAVTLLVACIIFFSLITSMSGAINSAPNGTQIEALSYLKEVKQDYPQGYLLTDDDYFSFIEYYSDVEPYFGTDKNSREVSEAIFYSRRFQDVTMLMSEANISFVMIDPEMTSGAVWANDREDLIFVLEHTVNFHKIYNKRGVKIYYFNATEE